MTAPIHERIVGSEWATNKTVFMWKMACKTELPGPRRFALYERLLAEFEASHLGQMLARQRARLSSDLIS